MIRHIVAFNLKPEVGTEDREWLFAHARKLLAPIPTVKGMAIGKGYVPPDASGKPKRPMEYDWAMTMEFDDRAAFEVYSKHPDHVAFGPEILKRASVLKVMDFES